MTTTVQKLTTIKNALSSIKAAIIAKGQTPSGDISTFATAIGNIDTGGGSSGTIDVDLTRFRDDTGTEIGTHYMNFMDANDNLYKVILLDARFRLASGQFCSDLHRITNMPSYLSLAESNIWEAKETATQNTQLILNHCSAGGFTSTGCSHCRSCSFTIGGVVYYGQMLNMIELSYVAKHYNEFDTMDTSASSSSSTNFNRSRDIWSSSQYSSALGFYLDTNGTTSAASTDCNHFVCPVLEIPV